MRNRYLLLTALVAGMAGCATGGGASDPPPGSPSDAASKTTLTPTGVGPLAFGESLAEAEKKLGEKAHGLAGDARCGYVGFDSLPGLQFTVKEGIVQRADAGTGVRNSLGVNLGDTVDSVVYLYPNLRTLRVPDSFGDTLLIYDAPGKTNAIVLLAAGNKIIGVRAGLNSAVGTPKGCP
jgi:hypothetical protein